LRGTMSIQAAESIVHPCCADLELSAVLHALSDPVRLRIVAELARGDGECTCGSIDLPVTKSTCTHHFKVLREAGVIKQRQQGTTRLNTLRRDDLESRFPGLLETILTAAERCGSDAIAAKAATAAASPEATAKVAAKVAASAAVAA
jgi:DNA-binding transcriptional ArsR family regulator